ncbi:putative cupin superfamily sugar epimerase [Bacillus mesophilus]|uniref:Cupin domain-containing protein n=1 Tax=Bacillus mesophilus TaxID=1808955 RepID=A0A6M0QAL4_9BACI|nr:cupin domain-containing protein [Bacillus mesophilus]MBM7662055.1 putative cupin superfamily sugar epimerase [Bacillus mesophilus]NEY72590.1 cupin domain-containing protein [Bacillus mesophilus]
MKQNNPDYWIEHLELQPHPEGGFYKATFTSIDELSVSDKKRKLYTSIYFLLRSEDISHFHRLTSDELWYFHGGSSLTIHTIDEQGEYKQIKLGLNLEAGEVPQALVRKNTIFGSSVVDENTFSLVGCMVSPGFDFEDFELFNQEQLLKEYPQHEEIIRLMAYK